jgi:hypothetical protein
VSKKEIGEKNQGTRKFWKQEIKMKALIAYSVLL